ncbi:MAG: antibiotic biosynthesis monooxygenase [Solirubrobacterales bacterium]
MMNVVHVREERQEAFERTFLERESRIHRADGFVAFELLRRDRDGEYLVLSSWETRADFDAYLTGNLFKASHGHVEEEPLADFNEVRHYEVLERRVPA